MVREVTGAQPAREARSYRTVRPVVRGTWLRRPRRCWSLLPVPTSVAATTRHELPRHAAGNCGPTASGKIAQHGQWLLSGADLARDSYRGDGIPKYGKIVWNHLAGRLLHPRPFHRGGAEEVNAGLAGGVRDEGSEGRRICTIRCLGRIGATVRCRCRSWPRRRRMGLRSRPLCAALWCRTLSPSSPACVRKFWRERLRSRR